MLILMSRPASFPNVVQIEEEFKIEFLTEKVKLILEFFAFMQTNHFFIALNKWKYRMSVTTTIASATLPKSR